MKLNKRFLATLQKSPGKGGWTYVRMKDAAKFFDTRGLVKVRGTMDGELAQPCVDALRKSVERGNGLRGDVAILRHHHAQTLLAGKPPVGNEI